MNDASHADHCSLRCNFKSGSNNFNHQVNHLIVKIQSLNHVSYNRMMKKKLLNTIFNIHLAFIVFITSNYDFLNKSSYISHYVAFTEPLIIATILPALMDDHTKEDMNQEVLCRIKDVSGKIQYTAMAIFSTCSAVFR